MPFLLLAGLSWFILGPLTVQLAIAAGLASDQYITTLLGYGSVVLGLAAMGYHTRLRAGGRQPTRFERGGQLTIAIACLVATASTGGWLLANHRFLIGYPIAVGLYLIAASLLGAGTLRSRSLHPAASILLLVQAPLVALATIEWTNYQYGPVVPTWVVAIYWCCFFAIGGSWIISGLILARKPLPSSTRTGI